MESLPTIDHRLPPDALARLLEYCVRKIEARRRGNKDALTRSPSEERHAFYRADLLRGELHSRLLRCLEEDSEQHEALLCRSVSAHAYLCGEPDKTGVDTAQKFPVDPVEDAAQRLEWRLLALAHAQHHEYPSRHIERLLGAVHAGREDLNRAECEHRFADDEDMWLAAQSVFDDLRSRVRAVLDEEPKQEIPAGARMKRREKIRLGDHVNGSIRMARGSSKNYR